MTEHDHVLVDVGDLTPKQTLRLLLRETIETRRMMADLTQAVLDLQIAVQGVLDRVGPTVDELKAQVAAGQQALADFAAADSAEDAEYTAAIAGLQSALQASVDSAQAAADAIEGSVATLNTVAAPTAPEPPVDEEPEPEPEPEPTPEEPPVDGGEVTEPPVVEEPPAEFPTDPVVEEPPADDVVPVVE